MCFIHISEQTATFAAYNFDWLVFFYINEMDSVYCAVGTESLHKTFYVSFSVCLKWRRAVLFCEAETEVLYLIDFQLVNEKQYNIEIRYHSSTVCAWISVLVLTICTVQNDTLHRRFVNGQDFLKQSAMNSYSINSDAARILAPGEISQDVQP